MKEDLWNILKIALLSAIVLLLASCKTIEKVEYVPVEMVRSETQDRLVEIHDSIYIHDSTVIRTKGDTVFETRWKYAYRDRLVHDTAYVQRIDSIPLPYPVEKELTKWQQFKIDYMGYLVAILIAVLASIIIYIRWRLKPRNNT